MNTLPNIPEAQKHEALAMIQSLLVAAGAFEPNAADLANKLINGEEVGLRRFSVSYVRFSLGWKEGEALPISFHAEVADETNVNITQTKGSLHAIMQGPEGRVSAETLALLKGAPGCTMVYQADDT